jgi:hypothetical protein
MSRKIYNTIVGKRPVGKPRRRWMKAVQEDSKKILSVRNWKRQAMNRQMRRVYIQKGNVDIGLLRHKEEKEGYFSCWETSAVNMAVAARSQMSVATGLGRTEKRRKMVPRIKLSIERAERTTQHRYTIFGLIDPVDFSKRRSVSTSRLCGATAQKACGIWVIDKKNLSKYWVPFFGNLKTNPRHIRGLRKMSKTYFNFNLFSIHNCYISYNWTSPVKQ